MSEAVLIPISDLKLSTRSYNALRRGGIKTVQELEKKSERDLLNLREFGVKSLAEVQEALRQHQQS